MKLAAAFLLACRGSGRTPLRLTVRTGETWLFTVKNGEPAQARKVTPSAKIPKGQIKVAVRPMLGTAMTVTNNSPIAYTFRAELICGRQGHRRSLMHLAAERPAHVRAMGAKGRSGAHRRLQDRQRRRTLLNDGQALFLLCGDERGEIDDPAAGRLQLSRARHGDDAVDRGARRPLGRGDDRLAHRACRRPRTLTTKASTCSTRSATELKKREARLHPGRRGAIPVATARAAALRGRRPAEHSRALLRPSHRLPGQAVSRFGGAARARRHARRAEGRLRMRAQGDDEPAGRCGRPRGRSRASRPRSAATTATSRCAASISSSGCTRAGRGNFRSASPGPDDSSRDQRLDRARQAGRARLDPGRVAR